LNAKRLREGIWVILINMIAEGAKPNSWPTLDLQPHLAEDLLRKLCTKYHNTSGYRGLDVFFMHI